MATTFRPYQPDQLLMLPESLQDWLPAGHLAHHVSDHSPGPEATLTWEYQHSEESPFSVTKVLSVNRSASIVLLTLEQLPHHGQRASRYPRATSH